MITTVSSTHCSRSPRPPDGLPALRRRAAALWLVGLALAFVLVAGWPGLARAEGQGAVAEMVVEPAPEGLFLSASTQFDMPTLAEDALYKGISMYFVAEAEVLQERWYWSDKVVARAARHMRLSYQPLTRRWRLNLSSGPFAASGLGVSLGQNFEDLADALAAMERISRWKIADASALDRGADYVVNFQFRLDMSQLPRPFQIGAMGRSGWTLLMSRTATVRFADPE